MMHAQTVDNYIIINQKYFPGDKILFLKDGKIFNRIEKGEKQRKEFYNEILDVLSLLGGDARC